MKNQWFAMVGVLAVLPAAAQTAKTWKAPRTPDGHPDLQGIWSNATVTPLERPADLTGKAVLSEEEAARFATDEVRRNNADRRDRPGTEADVARAYNDFWYDRGTKAIKTHRTSLIVDPPDGKIPALSPAAQQRVNARAEARSRRAEGPEDRSLSERCLNWRTAGPPMVPSAYNNNYRIVQTADTVVILNEMIHDVRVIPMDGRPHVPGKIRQWLGDSRGHWEGDTLVVETTNFTDKTAFQGASENMRLVERFTRVDADTLLYEFTVTDLEAFAKPWTAQIPSVKSDGEIFEYACHEGNYGMYGILSSARAEEKAAAGERTESR